MKGLEQPFTCHIYEPHVTPRLWRRAPPYRIGTRDSKAIFGSTKWQPPRCTKLSQNSSQEILFPRHPAYPRDWIGLTLVPSIDGPKTGVDRIGALLKLIQNRRPQNRRKIEGPQKTDLGHQILLKKGHHDKIILVGSNFIEVDLELVQFFIRPGCPNFVVLLALNILTGY